MRSARTIIWRQTGLSSQEHLTIARRFQRRVLSHRQNRVPEYAMEVAVVGFTAAA